MLLFIWEITGEEIGIAMISGSRRESHAIRIQLINRNQTDSIYPPMNLFEVWTCKNERIQQLNFCCDVFVAGRDWNVWI